MESYSFWNSKFVRWNGLASLFLNIFTWILLTWKIAIHDQDVVLHYFVYIGVDWFGPSWNSLYIPATALVFFIINSIIAYKSWKWDNTISKIIMGITVTIQLFALISGVIIVLANV